MAKRPRRSSSQWLPAHDRQSFLHGHLCLARRADARSKPAISTRALAIYEQQIKPAGPALSAAEHLHRRRLAAVAAVARRHRPGWSRIGGTSPPTASNISRRPARISPTFTTRWPQPMTGGDALRNATWRNWKRAPPMASWRPGRAAIDLCRGIKAFADGDNDGAIRLLEPADVRAGADRRQPRPARIVGGHPDRGLPARRPRRQGRGADLRRLERRPSVRDEAWSREVQARR